MMPIIPAALYAVIPDGSLIDNYEGFAVKLKDWMVPNNPYPWTWVSKESKEYYAGNTTVTIVPMFKGTGFTN